MEKTKILLVDDHKMIRDAIRAYIEKDDELEVVGEAANGIEALNKIKSLAPDIVFLDISMDGMDGITAAKEITSNHENVKVIALTMLNEYEHIRQMMEAGAMGYLLKNSSEKDVRAAISAVLEGNTYYSLEATQTVMNGIAKKRRLQTRRYDAPIKLTKRELAVLKLIMKEYSNQEIADKLFISLRTVDTHKRNLITKTGSKNLAGLILYAINNDVLNEEDDDDNTP